MKYIFISLIFFLPLFSSAQTKGFEFTWSWRTGEVPDLYISSENLFIKDMVVDPPEKVQIKLNKKERLEILNKMKEINFFVYPSLYHFESAEPTNLVGLNTPCAHHNIISYVDGKKKEVSWNDCTASGKSKDNKYENLRALEAVITKIIFNKPAYKKSKKPRAAYL